MRIFKEVILILFTISIFLFIHDVWVAIEEANSEDLFFPTLFEDDCFYRTIGREIKAEKIISFKCGEEILGGNGMHAEVVIFCDENCISSIKKNWDIERKTIGEIEKNIQRYEWFYSFKDTIIEKYYSKYQKPLNKAIISYYYYFFENPWEEKMLWYDHHSKILWYRKWKLSK